MRNLLKLTASLSAMAMAFSMAALLPAHAADTCIIDTAEEYQNIRGFGGMNLPEWVGSDLTDAQRQKAFGNGEDELGLTILRIYASDDSNGWKNAVPTALYAQKMGATIFATPWNPPASMCERFTRTATSWGQTITMENQKRLKKASYGAYAQHLNNYLDYMKSQGVNVYSISVQNEPDYAEEWTWWTPEECLDFIVNYGDQINGRLMSPETFQYYNKDYYKLILENPKAFENIDLFGTHFYGTQRSWMDFPALENSGKEIWMTEVYVPNSDANSADRFPEALDVSENIHNGLVVGNMSAYTWWYIRRSYGLIKEDGNISKRGYCMAQYSKFVRPGDVRIEATESPEKNVYISAFKNDNGQVTVVAVNKGTEGYAQQFSLSKGEKITDVDRYRTSASENIALTENLEYTGSSFWAQLPAQSVSTFIISTDGTEEPQPTESEIEAQPDENGYYFHDTFEGGISDWKGHGGTDVSLSGRSPYEGKEALIVQERTSAWHGTEKKLPSVFKAGKAYSFSVDALYLDGDNETDTFALTLQYKGSDGETHFASIARAETGKGIWVQLANPSFKIPEGATDMVIYVEATNPTNNIYIDEAIGAPEGTKISGPEPSKPEETEPEETKPEETKVTLGDVNQDGIINVFDLVLAKKGILNGFKSNAQALAADVSQNGVNDVADIIMLHRWLLGSIKELK